MKIKMHVNRIIMIFPTSCLLNHVLYLWKRKTPAWLSLCHYAAQSSPVRVQSCRVGGVPLSGAGQGVGGGQDAGATLQAIHVEVLCCRSSFYAIVDRSF